MKKPADFDRQYKLYLASRSGITPSPAEEQLEHLLRKLYRDTEVQAEFEVGNYRLDFLAADGIGYEVDGKNYHEYDRDLKRDFWILENSDVQGIVRLSAAVLNFFAPTCHAVFCSLLPHLSRPGELYQNSPSLIVERADRYFEQGLQDSELAQSIVEEPCFVSDGTLARIGYSGHWIRSGHPIWHDIDPAQHGRLNWSSRVEYRTLANRKRWDDYGFAFLKQGDGPD